MQKRGNILIRICKIYCAIFYSSVIQPPRKTLGFSRRDRRGIPFKAAWVVGYCWDVTTGGFVLYTDLYECNHVQIEPERLRLVQIPWGVVAQVSPQRAG